MRSRKVVGLVLKGKSSFSFITRLINLLISFRFLSFNPPTSEIIEQPLIREDDDVDIIIRPSSSRSINPSSGNNLLNANLSGSFREESAIPIDDDDNDEEILDGRVRRVPKRGRKHRSAPNILTSDQPSTSYGIPSSSFASSPADRLGVAAIPNIQFDPARSNNNFI